MTKLTGPFLVEQPGLKTRRTQGARKATRRRPHAAEALDAGQERLTSQVNQCTDDNQGTGSRPWTGQMGLSLPAIVCEAFAEDGTPAPPPLPCNHVRHPWWSRPNTADDMGATVRCPQIERPATQEQQRLSRKTDTRLRPSTSDASTDKAAMQKLLEQRIEEYEGGYAEALARWKTAQRDSKRGRVPYGQDVTNGGNSLLEPVKSELAGMTVKSSSTKSLVSQDSSPSLLELALALQKNRSISKSCYRRAALLTEHKCVVDRLKHLSNIRKDQVPVWVSCVDKTNVIVDTVPLSSLEGFVPRCAKCIGSYEQDEKAKFCRGCGEPRMDKRTVAEIFFAYIGLKRTIIRKTDLTKLVQHVRYMQHKAGGLTRQALHRVTLEINRGFDQTLAFQLSEGNVHSHGLTLEYFVFFLAKIAIPRSITVRELITQLMDEMHDGKHKDLLDDVVAAKSEPQHVPLSPTLSAVRALADQCTNCGKSHVSGESFCRSCGHKFQDDPATHDLESTIGGFSTFFHKTSRKTVLHENANVEDLIKLANQYNMSLDEVRRKRAEFKSFDRDHSGTLTYTEFIEVVRERVNIPAPEPIPDHLVSASWIQAAKSLDDRSHGAIGFLDFEEFLLWSCNTEYSEELLVTDSQERHLRKLAREHGILLPDVERIKGVFDRFDTDKTGSIDEEEFRNVLLLLKRIKNPADLSAQKVRRWYREIDADMSGSVSFEEFLIWYFNFFDG